MNTKWYVLIIVIGLSYTKQANAQYLSIGGDFEVDQQKGCNDLTVTITTINSGTDVVFFQYNGFNSPVDSIPVFTYTSPGSYWINQYIQGGTGQKKDSVLVIVVPPETPQVELQSCNNFELLVGINDNYYDVYEIDYGDGTIILINKNTLVPPYTYADSSTRNVVVTGLFNTASNRCGVTSTIFDPTATVLPAQMDLLIALDANTLKLNYQLPANSVNKLEVSVNDNLNYVLFKSLAQKTSVDTITTLNITQNTYCFRITTYDACSNFKSYSNEVCSIDLRATSQNNQITLDWNSFNFGPGQTTNLFRDSSLLQSIPSPTFQHIDSVVVCNTNYCYRAEISFTGGGVSRSLEVCETAFSTDIPGTVENISSITNSDSIDWSWQIPPNAFPAYYTVHQVNKDGNIFKSDSVGPNFYKAPFGDAVKNITIEVYDICNNTSPMSNVGSNIFLQGSVNQLYGIELNWNNYVGWVDGLQEYYVTIKDTQGVLVDSISTSGTNAYTLPLADQVDQTMVFTVWALPVTNGIQNSRSNILTFERDPIISIPNSFTPNGDGLNDKFVVTGKFIASYELQIFNRWGEMLFYTTDLDNGWDGNSGNKKMPVGNYAYWVRIKDLNNNEHIRTGSILILSN